MVKTRLQVSGDGTSGARNYKALGISGTVSTIFKEEGIAAFWKGIGAAWLREASYTSLRLGLYAPIKHAMGVTGDSHFLMKFTAGSLAGAIGSVAGNPFDVLKTRMMANSAAKSPKLVETASVLYKQQGRLAVNVVFPRIQSPPLVSLLQKLNSIFSPSITTLPCLRNWRFLPWH